VLKVDWGDLDCGVVATGSAGCPGHYAGILELVPMLLP